ncbi:hypothetical protein LDENG_00255000 [Lucifuga dentata]|nr:hypothetical protein LDENG_00255000 [Lucifuga dentata]
MYECGFSKGSIRHTAKVKLTVALLPDEIFMKINPLTVDCSEKKSSDVILVEATATIRNSTEKYRPVFSYCVNEKLSKVLNAANNFYKGPGATQEMALDIFAGLKNSSKTSLEDSSNTENRMADLTASINVLNMMASASEYFVLEEAVFPDFIQAASSMLNQSWGGVSASTKSTMSSNYLQSVESLVKNIKINVSSGMRTENLDLKFCSKSDCNMSVFDIGVNLNQTSGTIKAVGVKNLMNKLRNNYPKTEATGLLLSATLVDSNDSSVQITLVFPKDQMNDEKPVCVFWNTTTENWSSEGCTSSSSDENSTSTICQCNHLTSFSVLMSKNVDVLPFLNEITYGGLGVSICCLLLLLIIESLVWSAVVKTNLSHFRHTALVNISVCLLLADCSFLAGSFPEILSDTWCLILTICRHFFFLAMFCWMLCLSVMLVHQLIFVFNPLRKRVFMFFSTIIGYICPILMVGSSYVYYKYTDKPYYNKKTCWLTFEGLLKGSMHAFLLPVGTVVFINIFSMGVVVLTLLKTSVPDGSKADDKETAKSHAMRPFFVYAFTILNAFQGLFIFLAGCFAEPKVREEMFKLIMGSMKGKSESTKNLTTTTYSKTNKD